MMLDAEAIGATARFSTALPAINPRGGRVSGSLERRTGVGSQPRRETHARACTSITCRAASRAEGISCSPIRPVSWPRWSPGWSTAAAPDRLEAEDTGFLGRKRYQRHPDGRGLLPWPKPCVRSLSSGRAPTPHWPSSAATPSPTMSCPATPSRSRDKCDHPRLCAAGWDADRPRPVSATQLGIALSNWRWRSAGMMALQGGRGSRRAHQPPQAVPDSLYQAPRSS
jgi:hypothetical protein